jgi:hypothetical protein
VRLFPLLILLAVGTTLSAQTFVRPGFRQLDGVWIKPAGEFEPRHVISAKLGDDGRLAVAFDPTPDWRAKLQPGRRVVAEHSIDRGLWHLMAMVAAPAAAGPGAGERAMTAVLLAVDESPPVVDAPARLVRVTVTATHAQVRGVGRHDGAATIVEYRARADGGEARLTVQIQGKGGLDVVGEGLLDLLAKRPQIVRQFLGPLLRDLTGNDLLRPRPGDVYRAFDGIEPTQAEVAQLAAMLPRLNSPEPIERELAGERLQALGPGAVLAALRIDRTQLPPEVAARLQLFVRRNSLTDELDAASALADVYFLRECLKDPDPRVRDAAREQLLLLSD